MKYSCPFVGDYNADQAAAFQEVKTQCFVTFALVGESEVDIRLRGLSRSCLDDLVIAATFLALFASSVL